MITRRHFCQQLTLGAGLAAIFGHAPVTTAQATVGFGPLKPDPRQILNLPEGFQYQILSITGLPMSDGLAVPGWPDSMAVFARGKGQLVLLCNHELDMRQQHLSTWHKGAAQTDSVKASIYDETQTRQPAPGGVRRMVYDLQTGKLISQEMALLGTLRNCSGGTTPWGSWISCEETILRKGQMGLTKMHGYCFEVIANSRGLTKAQPLKAMGRFNHEAAAVNPDTGVIYLTEDQPDGLLYRFIPRVEKQLHQGGQLQALALVDSDGLSVSTGNQEDFRMPIGQPMPVKWVDVQEVNSPDDSLRYQGASAGAARFVRGEGMVVEKLKNGGHVIWVMATTGGAKGLGQVFRYRPSKFEGGFREQQAPGELTLFSESDDMALMKHGDNLALMPNGDLMICEDRLNGQRLIGLTAAGQYYVIAANARGASEFAGACFSPDGKTLFVNLQQQGGTLAIHGPWHQKAA